MFWRCLKDYFGYCKGEPQWEKPAEKEGSEARGEIIRGGVCKASPGSRGQYYRNPEWEKTNEH